MYYSQDFIFKQQKRAYKRGLIHSGIVFLIILAVIVLRMALVPADYTMTPEMYQTYLDHCSATQNEQ